MELNFFNLGTSLALSTFLKDFFLIKLAKFSLKVKVPLKMTPGGALNQSIASKSTLKTLQMPLEGIMESKTL